MHSVAIFALPGVIAFDLATPLEVFGRARLADGSAAYRVYTCAPTKEIDAGAFIMRPTHELGALGEADTIILPGIAAPMTPTDAEVLDMLRTAAARGARLASICAGAFTLAATGLLDGLRATTHWLATDALARRYPRVVVDPNVLFVDNGQFLTSAGAAAGLDLCLHLVRRDHGAAVAADAARLSVMPLEREGGQAQFIAHAPPLPEGSSLASLLHWLEGHIARDLTLAQIAAHAGSSPRTLNRRFREQTGTTPLRWLPRARLRRAQCLLETTDGGVEWIAGEVGFGSPTAFRERFKAVVGVSPQAYRRAFRGNGIR